jgi:hypothetical protein
LAYLKHIEKGGYECFIHRREFRRIDVVDFMQFVTGDFIRLIEQPFGIRIALREFREQE